MGDQFDVSLEDSELLDEVELTTSLIIAASECDGALSQDEIDRILGIEAEPSAAPAPTASQVPTSQATTSHAATSPGEV